MIVSKSRVFCLSSLLLSLLAATFETLSYLFEYDAPEANYFAAGSVLPVIGLVLAILAFFVGGVGLQFFSAEFAPASRSESSSLLRFASLPSAIGAAVSAWMFFDESLLCAFSLGIAFLFFLLQSIRLPKAFSELVTILGFFSVFAPIFLCADFYFDRTLEMNAPVKVATQMSLLLCSLFATCEIRERLSTRRTRLLLLILFALLSFGSLCAFPIPIATAFGFVTRRDLFAGAVYVLGVVLTACLRTVGLFAASNKQEESEETI